MILGAQLYTLREYTQDEAGFSAAMKKVSAMGYTTVQVSAIGPVAPRRVREICDENQLKIVVTHTDPQRIKTETTAVIREHEIMGCSYIGIGAMPEQYRSPEGIRAFIEDYREPAKQIAASGKGLMYHNHHFEFERFGAKRMIELLAEQFDKEELGFILDTYWVQAAGGDVCVWLRNLSDRIPCVHLKDMAVRGGKTVMAPVLEGNMDFKGILQTLEETGKTKYLLVEQDTCEGSPFDCLETSFSNLQQLGYR